ncbi:MAG: galactokinase [Acidimicrobiales bacterium]|nr:MAG: galactokinase [Acidimicrobiales bacterium]
MSTDGGDARARAIAAHREAWGEPETIVRAPGRVNLIGEHTDYNDGFVLPMALPFDTVIAVSEAPGGTAGEIRSEGFGRFEIDGDVPDWAVYIQAMRDVMREAGIEAPAWRGAIATDIPTGASLSSSAAVEVATGLAIAAQAGAAVDGVAIARFGQEVETRLLGVPTGIMDQLISATASAGSASLIDCRSLATTSLPVPPNTTVVVMDTMTRRELVDSEFAARAATCLRAADLLGVDALRDIADVADLAPLETKHPLEWRRAAHVVSENERTLAAAEALGSGEAVAFGALMNESHDSLRDRYEVSSPALDRIVDIARGGPGCLGARMTGGGFAGCAVALVRSEDVDAFVRHVADGYETWSGDAPRLWPGVAAAGASVETLA